MPEMVKLTDARTGRVVHAMLVMTDSESHSEPTGVNVYQVRGRYWIDRTHMGSLVSRHMADKRPPAKSIRTPGTIRTIG